MVADERPRLTAERERVLSELYAAQFRRLVAFAERALPTAADVGAEDVAQTVFSEAVATSAARPWVPIDDRWLFRRLRARIADQHRMRRRQQQVLAVAASSAPPPPSAEEIAVDGAAVDELLAAIPNADDRLTIAFRVYGYREAEIAMLLSVPYEGRRIRDRLQRIKRQADAWRAEASGRM